MNCTNKQQETAECEKRGCEGCYYNDEVDDLTTVYLSGFYDGEKKWKDKIKAKIEEYKKQIEKMEKDDIGIGFTLGKEWSDLKAKVEFGQSLLEKE